MSVAAFIFGFAAFNDHAVLYGVHTGPGAFYQLMPHKAMAALFGAAFLYAIAALVMGVRAFWRDIGEPVGNTADAGSLFQAMRDAGELRYLDGGGVGCFNEDDRPTDRRKIFHHLTFYGFVLCFAATSVATLYHYWLGREAPYAWWDLPVVLGTLGGIGLLIGPIGLLTEKWKRDPVLVDQARMGMDVAFIVMLFLTALPGSRCCCCATRLRWACCWRSISAWCSRCSLPCPMASLCTVSTATLRWCGMRGSGRRRDCATTEHTFSFLATRCVRVLPEKTPPKTKRAQEMPGRSVHPQPRVKKARALVTTGPPKNIRHFLRDGFNGFLRALRGDRAFLSPSPARCQEKLQTSSPT